MRIPSPPPSSAPKAAPSGGGGKAAAPAPASGGGKSQACDAIRQYVSSVAPGTNWAFSPAPDLSVDKLGNFLRGVASWDTPFDPLDTRRLAFTLDVGERIEVDMMKIDGERMDVSGLLSGDPRFVVKRLHPQSTVSGMGPGAGAESASGLRMLYAQRDPHACEALTDAGLLDWLLDALAASAPLGELLGLRTATVDFSVPRFAQLIQTDRPSHDFSSCITKRAYARPPAKKIYRSLNGTRPTIASRWTRRSLSSCSPQRAIRFWSPISRTRSPMTPPVRSGTRWLTRRSHLIILMVRQ